MEDALMAARVGNKVAVVVGCNYPHENLLKECQNDAVKMHDVLIDKFGFKPNSVKLLLDKPGNTAAMPTGARIKRELYSMIHGARSGDVLFFFFSGHGVEAFGRPEHGAIVAADDNIITRVDFRHMVDRVPKGASFTIMADSCYSGELIDKEPVQVGPRRGSASSSLVEDEDDDDDDDDDNDDETMVRDLEEITSRGKKHKMIPYETLLQRVSSLSGLSDGADIGAHMLQLFGGEASLMYTLPVHQHPRPLAPDQGILLSACQANETSGDGVFTNAFVIIVKSNRGPAYFSNRKMIVMARKVLSVLTKEGDIDGDQHPCLYCSSKNASAVFLGRP